MTTDLTPTEKTAKTHEAIPLRTKLGARMKRALQIVENAIEITGEYGDAKALGLGKQALEAFVSSLSSIDPAFVAPRRRGPRPLLTGASVWAAKGHANSLGKFGEMKVVSIDAECGTVTVSCSDGKERTVARTSVVMYAPGSAEEKAAESQANG